MNVININKELNKLYNKLLANTGLNESEKLLIKSTLNQIEKDINEYNTFDENDEELIKLDKIIEIQILNQLNKIDKFLERKENK